MCITPDYCVKTDLKHCEPSFRKIPLLTHDSQFSFLINYCKKNIPEVLKTNPRPLYLKVCMFLLLLTNTRNSILSYRCQLMLCHQCANLFKHVPRYQTNSDATWYNIVKVISIEALGWPSGEEAEQRTASSLNFVSCHIPLLHHHVSCVQLHPKLSNKKAKCQKNYL